MCMKLNDAVCSSQASSGSLTTTAAICKLFDFDIVGIITERGFETPVNDFIESICTIAKGSGKCKWHEIKKKAKTPGERMHNECKEIVKGMNCPCD